MEPQPGIAALNYICSLFDIVVCLFVVCYLVMYKFWLAASSFVCLKSKDISVLWMDCELIGYLRVMP